MFSRSETHINMHISCMVPLFLYSLHDMTCIHIYPVIFVVACTYRRTYLCLSRDFHANAWEQHKFGSKLRASACLYVSALFIAPVCTRCVCLCVSQRFALCCLLYCAGLGKGCGAAIYILYLIKYWKFIVVYIISVLIGNDDENENENDHGDDFNWFLNVCLSVLPNVDFS